MILMPLAAPNFSAVDELDSVEMVSGGQVWQISSEMWKLFDPWLLPTACWGTVWDISVKSAFEAFHYRFGQWRQAKVIQGGYYIDMYLALIPSLLVQTKLVNIMKALWLSGSKKN